MAQSQLQWSNMFTPPALPPLPGSTSPAGQPAAKVGRQRPKSRRPPPSPRARIVAPFTGSGRPLPAPRCALEGRVPQAANDSLPGTVLDGEDLLGESPPPPPVSGVRLSEETACEAVGPLREVTLPDDGAPPPMAALDLADELLGQLPAAASIADDLVDDLAALEDDDWGSPPVDSVAAMLVDAIAAYEQEPQVDLCERETGRYEAHHEQWLEGLDLAGADEVSLGRIVIIPERLDEETCRMERHR